MLSQVKIQHHPSAASTDIMTKSTPSPSEDRHGSTPEPASPPLAFGSSFPPPSSTPPSQVVGSMDSTSGAGMQPQPVLYSAIGSLENSSYSNMGSFRSRILHANNNNGSTPTSGNISGFASTSTTRTAAKLSINKNQQEQQLHYNSASAFGTLLPPASSIKPKRTGLSSALMEGTYSSTSTSTYIQASSTSTGTDTDTEKKQEESPKEEHSRLILKPPPRLRVEEASTTPIAAAASRVPKEPSESILKKPSAYTKSKNKRVTIDSNSKRVEMFRPSCDAYTPRIQKPEKMKYVGPELRTPVQKNDMGTISRPNFRDALRRVAMILHQHITKIEQRFESKEQSQLFLPAMRDLYCEDKYVTPRYTCHMVRIPMALPGIKMGMRQIVQEYTIPTADEIYEFAHQLFQRVQLSSECSIVCLIYVERLMEVAKVPLMAKTWRPVFMCGLLLASKVWQDLSSWNIEFASVYPQFSLEAINRLELLFLKHIKWDLYISSSLYAKYYFALRSLLEKKGFRQRYNRMVGGVDSVAASEALKVQQRTEVVKEEALSQLSRSM